MKTSQMNVKKIVLIGMLGAIGAILMFIRTPLPFMPPFMDFDLASLPEMIGGFALGPMAAVFIILVKILAKFAMLGTSSMFTGEIQNFLLSCAYVLPAVWIYDRHKSKKSAIQGMVVGTVICAIVAVFTNLYIIIPFYASLGNMTVQSIIDMCSAVSPIITNTVTLAIFGIIPFNLIKNGVASIITYVVYKKISIPMKKFAGER
ncbi:ECF transporter S component [Candidatus Stoquefichus massiliensis]|uniref:ECF transporter S component n=1 Tax=Candidatus Stoquefichus massiliensis TaxID=1470350 RepID=UPI000485E7F1|nr:ECF transporter S component [Candidatus Stoquefichus massiliensis]